MKPNIKIHFVKFVLSHNYWYCDFEFVRVFSNNKNITFCGNRLPWVYDASDTRLKIMLATHHSGTDKYQLELLYYGAYVQARNQHFVIFTQQTSITNTHTPNTEQNVFESFHFISTSRLNILQLEALNICRKEQVVCYDGPGDKSPILLFTYNQSAWECLSSTFQMVCTFSRGNNFCTKLPYLRYHAKRASDYQVKTPGLVKRNPFRNEELLSESFNSKGTRKYIYYHPETVSSYGIISRRIIVAFPYSLYQGRSCMYGGIYIVKTLSSMDFEIFSICAPSAINAKRNLIEINDLSSVSIVIIHYSEYSTKTLIFHAIYYPTTDYEITWLNQQYLNDETVSITVPTLPIDSFITIQSSLLKLRKVQYINISLDYEGAVSCIDFNTFRRTPCINITIFYSPHLSNIRGRHYDQETTSISKTISRCGLIQSIFINTNGYDFWNIPVWYFFTETTIREDGGAYGTFNIIKHFNIPTIERHVSHLIPRFPPPDFWVMVQLVRET